MDEFKFLATSQSLESARIVTKILDEVIRLPKSILDVGCGVGGTALHLAQRWSKSVHVTGITISSAQARQAIRAAQGQGRRGGPRPGGLCAPRRTVDRGEFLDPRDGRHSCPARATVTGDFSQAMT